jgi:hypothetical protein
VLAEITNLLKGENKMKSEKPQSLQKIMLNKNSTYQTINDDTPTKINFNTLLFARANGK